MHKIVRFPLKLNIFFSSLTSEFHWNHFEYFRTLVFLIVFSYEHRNIAALYRQLDQKNQWHRSRFNNFVNLSRWNPEETLEKKAYELLKSLKPGKGEIVELIIDDSKKKKTFCISKDRGKVQYRYVDAGWLDVSTIGNAHVIFSRKKDDGKIIGLVTSDPKFSAEKMIQIYDKRWSIEVFFKDAKQLLGLGQYQNGSYQAAVIHLHLVCFAYALLTHIAIKREGAKGKRKLANHLSIGELQNELRRIVWEDFVDYLNRFPDGNSVVKELRRLLMAS